MDAIDRKLLNLIQTEFPLVPRPFAGLARKIGIGADGVLEKIAQLKEAGIIRMIGPVIDSRSLGFQTTLAAMIVSHPNLEKAETVIAAHPGVSHGYERDHRFNIWFTLAIPPSGNIETELLGLKTSVGAEVAFTLPAVKIYKIGAYFDMDEGGQTPPATKRNYTLTKPHDLSDIDKIIINELQQDLPLIDAPFDAMSKRVGMDTEQFLAECRALQEHGVVRRFSASINHRNAGFAANTMTCWYAPSHEIDAAGRKLASIKNVSHCYERRTNDHWRYNLFAMIHGGSVEQCTEIVEQVSAETGLSDSAQLYSTKEFKKTRVKYLL